jgi:hypothetical protein
VRNTGYAHWRQRKTDSRILQGDQAADTSSPDLMSEFNAKTTNGSHDLFDFHFGYLNTGLSRSLALIVINERDGGTGRVI